MTDDTIVAMDWVARAADDRHRFVRGRKASRIIGAATVVAQAAITARYHTYADFAAVLAALVVTEIVAPRDAGRAVEIDRASAVASMIERARARLGVSKMVRWVGCSLCGYIAVHALLVRQGLAPVAFAVVLAGFFVGVTHAAERRTRARLTRLFRAARPHPERA